MAPKDTWTPKFIAAVFTIAKTWKQPKCPHTQSKYTHTHTHAQWNTEFSNYHTIAHISQDSKVMLTILQARLQQYVNHQLQMYKMDLEKAEEPEIKLPTSGGS